MARRRKKIHSSFHAPTERLLITKSSRTALSNTPYKQKKTDRRRVVKVNHGIVENILLVLFFACLLLAVFMLLR